jgi:DNA-binding NarL/FixJ family response regulator
MSSLYGNTLSADDTNTPYGKYRITDDEAVVLSLLIEGRNNRVIAKKLSISEQMVQCRLNDISRKFGVSNRLELVLFTIKNGLVAGNMKQ